MTREWELAWGTKYREKALELLALADGENNQRVKADLEALAQGFLRLAEQADRNAVLTIDFLLPRGEEDMSKPK